MRFPLKYIAQDAYQGAYFLDADKKYVDLREGIAALNAAACARTEAMPKPEGQDKLLAALRPFALYADSLYTLKDEYKIAGIYVRHFREAARIVNAFDIVQDAVSPQREKP